MRAKPHLRLDKTGARFTFDYTTPEKILPHVKTKEDLEKTLEWYSHPFLKLRVPGGPANRKRYMEKVRPALRWFCKKFGVNIPSWLDGNGVHGELPPEEQKELFGEEPLDVREFEEWQQEPRGEAEEA